VDFSAAYLKIDGLKSLHAGKGFEIPVMRSRGWAAGGVAMDKCLPVEVGPGRKIISVQLISSRAFGNVQVVLVTQP
jgi:hypothetical protein